MLKGLAILFGKCAPWVPPSPKAAIAAMLWFYGAIPGVSYQDYRAAVWNQYIAAGGTVRQANAAVAALDRCFAAWPQKPH